ncbi:MAG TPA: DcaP family trimeric outer membrane transporter [Anaeromyxobacteraceae bacterium]|nr:DcaP family trimeric outer membrane transporter [Anaeromyxobacteraceae bacterium]
MRWTAILVGLCAAVLAPRDSSADDAERKPSFEIYGFAQVDYIQDFDRMPPDWNATLRPTRIPTETPNPYGANGEAIFSARQTRLGFRAALPAGAYDVKARIEFDFFGRGEGTPDAGGQNTIRLRQAYGEWGPILGGLTASLFMDDDFWPNIIDYWGPCGMVFFRNVQIRYTPLKGEHSFAIALERPSADIPNYSDAIQYQAHNLLPDLTAQYRFTQGWGYVQLSGILRMLGYEPNAASTVPNLPKGYALGWGLNASSTVKLLPDKLNLLVAVVGGAGIENYMNDATPDVAGGGTTVDPTGQAVPMLGISAYLDVYWSALFTSAVGYSTTMIFNTSLQASSAFKMGQYTNVNLLVHPFRNFMAGPEFLWGQRNDKGGASGIDLRLQISLKFSFSSLDFWKPT